MSRNRWNSGIPSGAPRRATWWDKVRTTLFATLLNEGQDELDAFWRCITDERCGIKQYRGAPASARPTDLVLRRKMSAMLSRAVPEAIEASAEQARARIALMQKDASDTILEVVRGENLLNKGDAAIANTRMAAAKLILDTIGVGGKQPVQVSVQQNNVTFNALTSVLSKLNQASGG